MMSRVQLALTVLVLLASSASAQVFGRLSGSVVDQSGAPVPGATVNVYIPGGKDPVLTSKTNDAGLFIFIGVRPDSYDVGVESKGFARVMLRKVTVEPLQETGLGVIKLEVATTRQTVDVTTEVQTVQLSNVEVSSTITNTQIENLPVLGRQVNSLFATQAGVNSGNDTTSINGLRSSLSVVTLDGINIQDNYIRTNALDYMPLRTTIDQISEMTVNTANGGATTGGGASQIALSSRSGSNDFHGAFYWYNRNSALAANDWFNNKAGVKRGFIDLNQPGAYVGGRILRDKLFFFVDYELYRNKRQSSSLTTVLTDSARNGIFQYRDSGRNLHSVNLQTLRNFTTDPTIKAMIAQLPEPNTSDRGDGLNTAGYRFNARSNEFRDQFLYKGDYYLSSKHSFSGTYDYITNPTDRPDLGSFYTTLPPVSNTIKNHLLSLAWRWTASAALTNELRGGFLRADTSFLVSNQYPKYLVTGLLFTNPINTYMNQGRKVGTYNIQDNANWVHGKHQIAFGFQAELKRVAPFNDGGILPSYALGISASNKNGLTSEDLAGIGATDLNTANSLYTNLAGIISSATQTFNVTSTTSGFVPGATNLRQFHQDSYAAYIQDNWKVQPRLTVSLGLRYEYWKPLDEINGLYLAPRLENNNIIQTMLDPNGILDFIGGPTGTPFYKSDKNNFAPNVGLAWDPFGKGKTSVRAGYMIAYASDNHVLAISNNVNTGKGLQSIANQIGLVGSLTSPPAVPTPAYKVPRTLLDNYTLDPTSATGRPDPGLVTPYIQQWTIGIQHEVKGMIFEARYLGNHGTKLIRVIDYNQVLYNANGFLADFRRAQNNAALSQTANGSYNGAYNAAVAGSQPLTVFPLLSNANFANSTVQTYLRQGQVGELANYYQNNRFNGAVNFYRNPNILGANVVNNSGSSNYNGLQLEMRKRTRAGLQLQFNYTFSKNLSNMAGDNQIQLEPLLDNDNPSLEKGRSPYDIRHAFRSNFYYELPFGAGKKKWSLRGVTNAIAGGWAVSGIWTYEAGSPYSVISGLGTLNRGSRSTSTNTASVNGTTGDQLKDLTSGVYMTGTGPYFLSPSLINPADGRGAEFGSTFPGELFFNPVAGTVGNTQRRYFTGPWQWRWNASVKKEFQYRERYKLDFHFDFFNWMNHPTFYIYPSDGGDYGSITNFNINNATFGKITAMNFAPRTIQIGAYFRF
jgi:hypothetical protein